MGADLPAAAEGSSLRPSPSGLGCGGVPQAFGAPWQAQIFALVQRLRDADLIEAGEWSAALGARLAALDPLADGETVWACWVAALEDVLLRRRIASPLQLTSLRQSWAIAAEKTPHGQPIELGRLAYRLAGLDAPLRDRRAPAPPQSPAAARGR